MTITSLWRNFSGNVFANSYWNCLLIISASEVHWRVKTATVCCQTQRQIHVSLTNAVPLREQTVLKWLKGTTAT